VRNHFENVLLLNILVKLSNFRSNLAVNMTVKFFTRQYTNFISQVAAL